MNEKTHYNYQGRVFILKPLSDSVVRVTHRDQTGHFGYNLNWEPSRPYTQTRYEGSVDDDGIERMGLFSYSTPDAALNALCDSMLRDQQKEDARRVNPEERQRAARQVLAEFMDELPVPGSRYPPEVAGRMGRAMYRRDIRITTSSESAGST